MTMHTILQRTLLAYRPLYLNGLLLDGRYRLPTAAEPAPSPSGTRPRPRKRALLVALSGLGAHFFSHRNAS
jgi:hypothetical protein